MVDIEKIELCYDASPDLEWVATEEARRFADIYQRLRQLDSLSVQTYLHAWRFSSELIFWIEGNPESLEEALRILYKEAGIPVTIARNRVGEHAFLTFVGSRSSKGAIEISERIIKEINPNFNMKGIYVSSCRSRGYPNVKDTIADIVKILR